MWCFLPLFEALLSWNKCGSCLQFSKSTTRGFNLLKSPSKTDRKWYVSLPSGEINLRWISLGCYQGGMGHSKLWQCLVGTNSHMVASLTLYLLSSTCLCFSHLQGCWAPAVERHETEIIGMEFTELECVVTTGKCFSFIWFQLNTLDMADRREWQWG